MANIFLSIEKGIEVAASDVLKFITGAQKVVSAAPQVAAALGTVLGAVATAVTTGEAAAAAGGLNFALDEAEIAALKAVWPDVVAFMKTLGVTL